MKLSDLEKVVNKRIREKIEHSYTYSLYKSGEDRVIQKIGEESIETVIALKNLSKQRVVEEVTDLLYHLLIGLKLKAVSLEEIETEIAKRHQEKTKISNNSL